MPQVAGEKIRDSPVMARLRGKFTICVLRFFFALPDHGLEGRVLYSNRMGILGHACVEMNGTFFFSFLGFSVSRDG